MKKEEFYSTILGKSVTITGGTKGMGFSYTGYVTDIIGDTVIIDNLVVVLSGIIMNIDHIENHFHVNFDNGNEIFVSLLDNFKQ